MSKTSDNPITKVHENIGRLECEECGNTAAEMISTKDGLLCCNECIEAHLRRKRFEDEEEEWNSEEIK